MRYQLRQFGRSVQVATTWMAIAAMVTTGLPLHAADFTWDGNTGVWSDPDRWGGVAPSGFDDTDVLHFYGGGDDSYVATNDFLVPFGLNQFRLAGTSRSAGTVAGNQLTFRGADPAILQNGAAAFVITNPIELTTDLILGGGGTGLVALDGAIHGAGGLVKYGGSSYTLNGGNSFTGPVSIFEGSLRVANADALGAAAGPTAIMLGGGMLEIRADSFDGFQDKGITLTGINSGTATSTLAVGAAMGGQALNQTLELRSLSMGLSNRNLIIQGRNGTNVTFLTGPDSAPALNSTITLTNNSNGVVTFKGDFYHNNTTSGTARTLTISGTGDTVVEGNLLAVDTGASGLRHLTKSGGGTLTILGNQSTINGNTSISGGRLAIYDFGALGVEPRAGTRINIGSGSTIGRLTYLGDEVVLDRTVNLAGTTGGAMIQASGSGALIIQDMSFTGGTASNAKLFTITGDSSPDILNEIRGNITNNNNGGMVSLIKTGSNTWVLSGENTYSGTTTITNGRLVLRADSFDANVIQGGGEILFRDQFLSNPVTAAVDILPLGVAGGVLEYQAHADGSMQQLGAVVAGAGMGTVQFTMPEDALGPGYLIFDALTFSTATTSVSAHINSAGAGNSGGSVNFVAAGDGVYGQDAFISIVSQQEGFINGRAYFQGNNFAFYEGESVFGHVRGLDYTSDANAISSNLALTAGFHNEITGNVATNAAMAIESLKISGGHTLSLDGNLTIATGGLLVDGGQATISGAAIQTSGNAAMALNVHDANDVLLLDTVVSGTTGGLIKNGNGTLIVAGANTQTGTTNINDGTVMLAEGGRLSNPNQGLNIRQGATLDLNGVDTGTAIGRFSGAGSVTNSGTEMATLTIGNGTTATSSNGVGTFSGILQDGDNGGALAVTVRSHISSTTGFMRFTFTGENTYTGPTTITKTLTRAGGIWLNVSSLSDIGEASGIGRGNVADNAGSLLFHSSDAALNYIGSASVSTNRLFTFAGEPASNSIAGARLMASGANNATIVWSNTGPLEFANSEAQTLVLGGTSLGENRFNPQLTDNPHSSLATSLTKVDAGFWILGNEANSYTGLTTVANGVLQANDGGSLPTLSGLVLSGGIFQSQGLFDRGLSPDPDMLSLTWTGGGFAASTDKLVVAIGGLATPELLQWGNDTGFLDNDAPLLLGSATSLAEVELINNIDLVGATRTINVATNVTTGADLATISGDIVNNGFNTAGLVKTGTGRLQLLGNSTYDGDTWVQAGTLVVNSLGGGAVASSSLGSGAGSLDLGSGIVGATLVYVGDGEVSDRLINLTGTYTGTSTSSSNQPGAATFDASGSGALILTNVVNAGDAVTGRTKTLTLTGENTGLNEISSVLGDHAQGGVLAVVKRGTGTWVLSGDNTYSGNTTINQGALIVTGAKSGGGNTTINGGTYVAAGSNAGTGATSLSTGTLVIASNDNGGLAGGNVTLTNGTILAYGEARSFSNNITIANNLVTFGGDQNLTMSGGVQLNNNRIITVTNTGMTEFSGAVGFAATGSARTWTINGTGDVLVSGAFTNTAVDGTNIGNVTGLTHLTINNTGTVTLAGENSYTGNTTVTGGTLLLDYTLNDGVKLGGGLVRLHGGTLALQGSGAQNTVVDLPGGLFLGNAALSSTTGGGGSSVVVAAGDGQEATLNLGQITREWGGTVDFHTASPDASMTTTNTSLGGWATYGGSTFATVVDTEIIALSLVGNDNVATWSPNANVTDVDGYFGTHGGGHVGSIVFNAVADGSTVTIADGADLTIDSGGMLVTEQAGAGSIVGGTLRSGLASGTLIGQRPATTTDLVVHQHSSQAFTIASRMDGSMGLTKSGSGTLVIAGENYYTGNTNINEGTLRLATDGAISPRSWVYLKNAEGVVLDLDNTYQTVAGITGGGAAGGMVNIGSGTLHIANFTNSTATFAGNFAGDGTVIKSGTHQVTLTGGNADFTGQLVVADTVFQLSGAEGSLRNANQITISGVGTLLTIQDQSFDVDRIGDNATVTLNNTGAGRGLWARTTNSAGRVEVIGDVVLGAGHNTIQATTNLVPNPDLPEGIFRVSTLEINQLTRQGHATLLVRGQHLGAGPDANQRGRIRIGAGLDLVGGDGSATTNHSVIPYLVGHQAVDGQVDGTSAGILGVAALFGNSFVTYDEYEGLRPLDVNTEYVLNETAVNALDPVSDHNVRFTADGVLAGDRTFNALVLDAAGGPVTLQGENGSTLTLASGALLATATPSLTAAAPNHAITLGGVPVVDDVPVFGAENLATATGEYLVFTTTATNTLTINSKLSTAEAVLTKSGAGTLVLTADNDYAGGTFINQGLIQVNSLEALGSGDIYFDGGGLKFGAAFDPTASSRELYFGTGGAVLDTNGLTVSVNYSMGGGGQGSLNKIGGGTLRINAAAEFQGDLILSGGTTILGAAGAVREGIDIRLNTTTSTLNVSTHDTTFGELTAGANLSLVGFGDVTFTGDVTQLGGNRTLTINNYGVTTFAGQQMAIVHGSTSNRTMTFSIGANPEAVIIESQIVDGSGRGAHSSSWGVGSLSKTSVGTLLLDNDQNSFSGFVTVLNGVLEFRTIGNVGEYSALGTGMHAGTNPDTLANQTQVEGNGRINLGSGTSTGTLRYIGIDPDGHITNRVINLASTTTGGGVIEASGLGALVIQNISNTAGTEVEHLKTLTLSGVSDYAVMNELQGVLTDSQLDGSLSQARLAKTGTNTWVVSSTQLHTGGSEIDGGRLILAGAGTLGGLGGANGDVDLRSGVLELTGIDQFVGTLTMGGSEVGTNAYLDIGAGITLAPESIVFDNAFNNNMAVIGGAGTLDLGVAGITVTVHDSNANDIDMSWEMGTLIGDGLFVKEGLGTLDIRGVGDNQFGGTYQINAGAILGLDFDGINLVLNGGVYEGNGTFDRGLGDGPNQVQWAAGGAGGGFAASGGALLIDMAGAPETLVWGGDSTGTPFFVPDAGALVFGSATADDVVTFNYNLDLNSGTRTIAVYDNATVDTDWAVLGGVISNGGLAVEGTGTLALTGANTFADGLFLNGGVVRVDSLAEANLMDPGPLGQGAISFGGGTLQYTGTDVAFSRDLAWSGISGIDVADANAILTFNNVITGDGTFVKSGAGALVLGGIGPNDLGDAATVVTGGLLQLAKGGAPDPGPITTLLDPIGSDETFITAGAIGTGDLSIMGGTVDLNGFYHVVGALNLGGGSEVAQLVDTSGQSTVLRVQDNLTYLGGAGAVIGSAGQLVTVYHEGLARQVVVNNGDDEIDLTLYGTLMHRNTEASTQSLTLIGDGRMLVVGDMLVGRTLAGEQLGTNTSNLIITGTHLQVDGNIQVRNSIYVRAGAQLDLLNENGIYSSAGLVFDQGGGVVNGPGVLDLRGTVTVGTTSTTTPASTGVINTDVRLVAGTRTFNIVQDYDTLTINGNISNDGSNRTLQKSGLGTLVLAGDAPNTYNGTTTVNAGALILQKELATGTGSVVFHRGTIDLNGHWQDFNSLTIGRDGVAQIISSGHAESELQVRGTITYNAQTGLPATIGTEDERINLFITTGSKTWNIQDGDGEYDLIVQGGVTRTATATSTITQIGGGTIYIDGDVFLNRYADGSNVGGGSSANLTLGASGNPGIGAHMVVGGEHFELRNVLTLRDHASLTLLNPNATGSFTTLQFHEGGGELDGVGAQLGLRGNIVVGQAANPDVLTEGLVTADLDLTANRSVTVVHAPDTLTITGALRSTGGNFTFTQNGAGTVVLAGDNTLTGTLRTNNGSMVLSGDNSAMTGSVVIAGGALVLDYSADNDTPKANLNSLSINAGRLVVQGNAEANTIVSLSSGMTVGNVISGASTIEVRNGDGQAAVLQLFNFTRPALSTMHFVTSSPDAIITTTETELGAWATFNGTSFAAVDGGGQIVAAASTAQDNVAAWAPGADVRDSAGYFGEIAANSSVNSIVFNSATPGSTVTIADGARLDVATGGILIGANAAGGSIEGGELTTSNASGLTGALNSSTTFELIVHQHAEQDFTIGSSLDGALGVTKSGAGTLVLAANNIYTGSTAINEGTLRMAVDEAIGNRSTVYLGNSADALWQLNGTTQTVSALWGGGNAGGTVDLDGSTLHIQNYSSVTRTFGGQLVGDGILMKSGTSTQAFSATSADFTGQIVVNEGYFQLSGGSGLLNNAAHVVINTSTAGGLLLVQDQSSNRDRIGDNAIITLNNTAGSSGLISRTTHNSARTETVGTVILGAGHNVIQATTHTGNNSARVSTLVINQFERQGRTTALVRGHFLGDDAGMRGRIVIAEPTDWIGGNGAANTTNRNIIPYLVGHSVQLVGSVASDTAATGVLDKLGNSFVTWNETHGLRPLDLNTEYQLNTAGYTATAADDNVRFTTSTAGELAGRTINSLVVDSSAGSVLLEGGLFETITLASGAMLATAYPADGATPIDITLAGPTTALETLTDEYLFFVTNPQGQLTVEWMLATENAALVKSGAGTLTLSGFNVYTGGTYMNQGLIEAAGLEALGTGELYFDGGGVRFGAAFDLTEAAGGLNFATGGAVFDTAGNDVTFANSFGNGGVGGLTKTGAGVLTLAAAANFSGDLTLNGGTLRQGVAGGFAAGVNVTVGGGTLDTGAFDTTLGSLRVNANSTITGSGEITFTDDVAFSGGSRTLTINNTGGLTTFAGQQMTLVNVGTSNRTNTFSLSGTGTVVQIDSQIVNTGVQAVHATGWAVGTLQKSGTGTLRLTNDYNTFSGHINHYGGVLEFTSVGNIGEVSALGTGLNAGTNFGDILQNQLVEEGNGRINIGSGSTSATLRYIGADVAGHTTNRTINLSGTSGNGTIDARGVGALVIENMSFTGGNTAAHSKQLILTGTSDAAVLNAIRGNITNGERAPGVVTVSLTKSGANTWAVFGENTFTGNVNIQAGTLVANMLANLGETSSLGAGTTAINLGNTTNTGTLRYVGDVDVEIDRVFNLNGTTGGGGIESSGVGTLSLLSDLTATGEGDKSLTLGGTNTGANIFWGDIVNSSSATNLVKEGAGTWILQGDKSYTGTTTIHSGTLVVQGTIATNVTINDGGRLAGTGTLNEVTINSGGIIAAGNSPGELKLGDTEINGGSRLEWSVAAVDGTPGIHWSLISIDGGLTVNSTSLDPVVIDVLPLTGAFDTFDLFSSDYQENQGWLFATADEFVVNGSTLINSGFVEGFGFDASAMRAIDGFQMVADESFTVYHDLSTSGLYVSYSYVAVPEPGSLLLVGMGALGFAGLGWRRRRCGNQKKAT